MLESLPPSVRDAVLRYYLEMDEHLPCEQVMARLLQAMSSGLKGEHQLVLSVPLLDGWLAISSGGQHYTGAQVCQANFGCPDGWSSVVSKRLNSRDNSIQGWLTVFSPDPSTGPDAEAQTAVWGRIAEQLVNRHCHRELSHSYEILVEAAVDAIITIDDRGIIQLFNPGAVRMFGYQVEEIVGKSVNVLMPLPYSVEHDDYLKSYQSTGDKKIIGIGRKVPARRKDGSIFPAHLAVSEFKRGDRRYYIGTLRDLSEFVEARSRAVVEERKHLSRELHDSVSQALFGIVLGTLAIKNGLGPADPNREAVDYVLHLAESGLAEMRTLIFELRPESLESEGLLVCLNKQSQALANRYKIEVKVESNGEEPSLKLPIKHEVYRLVMEALHNVVKHAQATGCRVLLVKEPGEYKVCVEDNGKGFELNAVPVNRVGLSSMRERVAQMGGRIQIDTAPGQGTRITVHFPASVDS
ncbi:PAS domain S-box protein [bacterium]|nr:PAS domain S-box protein [bacterium]